MAHGSVASAATNPALLLEVTSRSTEDCDRGDELSHYEQLGALRAVLFVSHRGKHITVLEREGAAWVERDCRGGEHAAVPSLSLSLAVDALYAGVTLETVDAGLRRTAPSKRTRRFEAHPR